MPVPRSHGFLSVFGAAVLVLLGHQAAVADEAARVRSVVAPIIGPLMAQYAVPGMAVAISLHGQAHVLNFGVASKASGQAVGDATIFEIGSISKTLTATLGAYAEATGKLSLSDHPGKYISELRGKAIDRATLLHFGTYTAGGLPLQFPEAVVGQKAMLAYYADWRPAAPPASIREYSNPSLGLFGLAASHALGMGFASAMESLVFPAFGMTSTFIHVPERAAANYAWGYRGEQAVRVNPGPMDEQTYGVKTTAADLLRFVQANLDPATLSGAMKRAVLSTQVGRFRAGPLVQGLGWEQYGYPTSREWLLGGNAEEVLFDPLPVQKVVAGQQQGPRLFNKTGSTGGFGAYLLFVPAEQFGLVILANRNYPIPARVEAAHAILTALVGERPEAK
nr:class C beta-lactamase [uncultured Roseateles sp.]